MIRLLTMPRAMRGLAWLLSLASLAATRGGRLWALRDYFRTQSAVDG